MAEVEYQTRTPGEPQGFVISAHGGCHQSPTNLLPPSLYWPAHRGVEAEMTSVLLELRDWGGLQPSQLAHWWTALEHPLVGTPPPPDGVWAEGTGYRVPPDGVWAAGLAGGGAIVRGANLTNLSSLLVGTGTIDDACVAAHGLNVTLTLTLTLTLTPTLALAPDPDPDPSPSPNPNPDPDPDPDPSPDPFSWRARRRRSSPRAPGRACRTRRSTAGQSTGRQCSPSAWHSPMRPRRTPSLLCSPPPTPWWASSYLQGYIHIRTHTCTCIYRAYTCTGGHLLTGLHPLHPLTSYFLPILLTEGGHLLTRLHPLHPLLVRDALLLHPRADGEVEGPPCLSLRQEHPSHAADPGAVHTYTHACLREGVTAFLYARSIPRPYAADPRSSTTLSTVPTQHPT